MNIKKLIGTGMIALLVVALSVSMAAAQGAIQSTDATAASEINNFVVGDEVYARGLFLTDPDGNGLVDVYIVVDGAKEEIWYDGEPIVDPTDHPLVLVKSGVHNDTINIFTGTGPLLLGTVVNKDLSSVDGSSEIPAPGSFDIVYDCNRDGYFNASDDCVDYGICSGFTTDIPEFATLAIPVVALLGLVLFMRRKKD